MHRILPALFLLLVAAATLGIALATKDPGQALGLATIAVLTLIASAIHGGILK